MVIVGIEYFILCCGVGRRNIEKRIARREGFALAKKTGNNSNGKGNLKPFKSVAEAREKGRKGGIKSQQVQRERRKAKECMNMILAMNATGDNGKKLMSKMGIKEEEQQNIMLLMATMFAKASTTGDPNAIKSILEIAGEMNAQAEQNNSTININVMPATINDNIED